MASSIRVQKSVPRARSRPPRHRPDQPRIRSGQVLGREIGIGERQRVAELERPVQLVERRRSEGAVTRGRRREIRIDPKQDRTSRAERRIGAIRQLRRRSRRARRALRQGSVEVAPKIDPRPRRENPPRSQRHRVVDKQRSGPLMASRVRKGSAGDSQNLIARAANLGGLEAGDQPVASPRPAPLRQEPEAAGGNGLQVSESLARAIARDRGEDLVISL